MQLIGCSAIDRVCMFSFGMQIPPGHKSPAGEKLGEAAGGLCLNCRKFKLGSVLFYFFLCSTWYRGITTKLQLLLLMKQHVKFILFSLRPAETF